MNEHDKRASSQAIEIDSTDRWVAGKNKQELLSDLKVYLARLRDDPRSLVDRLRVAAIQLRLGRVDEALIHYEGVLRGYVGDGQIMSAIALCQRILAIYPDLPRIQRILAALYARAPRGATGAPAAVTPIQDAEDETTSTFIVSKDDLRGIDDEEPMVVDRVFTDGPPAPKAREGRDLLSRNEDFRPTLRYEPVGLEGPPPDDEIPQLLTRQKSRKDTASPAGDADESDVMLLTRRKPPAE